MSDARGWLPAAAALLVLVVLGAGGYGAWRLYRAFETPPALPPPPTPEASPRPADARSPRAEDAGAREGMRRRYRPGPHVRVEGLLPTGLSALAAGPGASRTIDSPWVVAGAELRAESPPAGATARLVLGPGEGPAPRVVIVGVPTSVAIRSLGEDVAGVVAELEGWPGTFFVPNAARSELGNVSVAGDGEGRLELGVGADARFVPEKETRVTLRLAAVDVGGRRSPWVTRELRVLPVGAGDVEVTLAMSAATDLDLYVVGPAGVAVYYGQKSGGGGRLDLDANAACESNLGVDTEHVVWPRGSAPPGTYQVRVANYESCIGDAPVDYRVTVRACGEVAVLAGRFPGAGDPRECLMDPAPGDLAWCQRAVTFDVPPCAVAPKR
ncbi:MAG: hypothetical protein AAGH15_07915 [Myxococcota bacterium]